MSSEIVNVSRTTDDPQTGQDKQSVTDEPTMADEKVEYASPYHQDAFGNEEFAEVKYKVLKWWQCSLLMIAETISLGILSLPAGVAGLGLVPAVIILVGLGILATYTAYVIGQFKWRYPHISNMSDAGEVLMGWFGRELLFTGQMLYLVFIMGSHILIFSQALNSISSHGTCTIVFGIIGLIISFIFSLPRTLAGMTWLSLASFISIVAAVLTTMIAVGIQNKGAAVKATVDTDLVTGFVSVSNIVFSHSTFFAMIAELRNPRDFPRVVVTLQTVDISIYIVTAVVIYYYAGDSVASPALGSAGPLASRIAYGVALPTIVISGVVYGHVAFKAIYVRIFAHTDRIHKQDFVAVSSWIGIALSLWIIAWIIASAIPVFSNLLSLMSALFGSWFTYGLPAIFWLYMNRSHWFSSPKKVALTLVNTLALCVGIIVCGLGLYTSGKAIHDQPGGKTFSCANNL
ncbi:hypothetical protein PHISCL_05787 [Aspergillus sclerotialis]|uniref:Amino acid transporter transmembrane domain-containing protein n=1 Tax=Aspergillus sclerotialis TaxID=2070753 RepID=A0A3A2ZFC8_9EURO|nr:hypothetical protein PHISCL_05787 [Aspergillus sclerotialis]